MARTERPKSSRGAPSTTAWRRERLLRIGSSQIMNANEDTPQSLGSPEDEDYQNEYPDETTTLGPKSLRSNTSYGTLPVSPARTIPLRRGLSDPYDVSRPGRFSFSASSVRSASAFRRFISERPISAYDQPINSKGDLVDSQPDADAKANGIRVWYSSYTSIDWLHDAIKDSVRFGRMRRRRSFRARLRLAFDRSLGWIMVTLVGFLTAISAFLVVRSEQWLFDLKEGYCTTGWWKAERFCCSRSEDDIQTRVGTFEASCDAWRTWSQTFAGHAGPSEQKFVQYISYTFIALMLAASSCLLTVHLTKSTLFTTRKESGVLSPGFDGSSKVDPPQRKRKIMYYAAGSGIPEIKTILSGFVIHGYLGGRTLFTKSLGLALSVASGLSLGKEGPFVHIASCIGNIISRVHSKYENNEGKRREILSAACAAGVAVAFGAPIGGTLFSLEEVSYFFPPKVMWRSFFCAMIAAITLKLLNPYGTGKLVLFQIQYNKDWHAYELLPFILLGIIGGVYGAYFSKLNYLWCRHVRNATWIRNHALVEVLLVTLLTTILCFLNPYTRMGGTELVYRLFAECRTGSGNTHAGLCILDPTSFSSIWPTIRAILIAMVVKGALTIITFGIKVPAGIFIPTLGVGACAGRVVGIFMEHLQATHSDWRLFDACAGDLNCVMPGLYAMVGAAAALSGVTRTTVSLAVIMFELTDSLTYGIPVMLAVLVAKTVADALEPKGIYDLVIELSELPYLDAKQEYSWGNVQLGEVTDRDVEVIRLDRKNTVCSLRDQLQALHNLQDDTGLPILRSEVDGMRMVGYIGTNELEHALSLVAEDADEEVHFHTNYSHVASASITSLLETGNYPDPFDFSIYMDQAPLTVPSSAPLQLVHQFFAKLGARYVVITDTDGLYEGIIDKKTWLAFLNELEEKS